jgi:molybdate transport system ATP-binding protein
VLDDVSFTVGAGEVVAIVGPSGCGKSTLLSILGGLLRPSNGAAELRGTPPSGSLNPLTFVFQDFALLPWCTVDANVEFPLLHSPLAVAARRAVVDDALRRTGLTDFRNTYPKQLSGGMRQRVGIARALAVRPAILLMDEPLSALDRLTTDEILPFLERLHESLSLPVIYVSHDMAEIERLADHLILMQAGRVTTSGPLAALQSDPALPLARGRDAAVSLDARIEAYDAAYGLATCAVDGGQFLVPAPPVTIGEHRRLRVFAGDVSLAREPQRGSTIINILPARILKAAQLGEHEVVAVLGLGAAGTGVHLLSRTTKKSWDTLAFAEGMTVFAQIKGVALASARNRAEVTPSTPPSPPS